MIIPRKLPDTLSQIATYGAIRRNGDRAIQIVRTSPRRITLLRAYRESGKQWAGVPMSFEDWYLKVVEFQRAGGHTVL